MITDIARTKAHFFLDSLKKEIRQISTSITPKTENGNSTVAYPILIVRGNDNGVFNRIKSYMLKYDRYMTCEDRRTNGNLTFKFKSNEETENFLFSYGEENSNTNNQENANSSAIVSIDPKSRLDSLKSLLRKAGLKSGLHCSDVKFANDEAIAKYVATVYNCSKLQGERTLYYLLECGFNAHVGSKPSVTLVELPNESDYAAYFKEGLGADCFPPKSKIDEEQKAKDGTKDHVSEGKSSDIAQPQAPSPAQPAAPKYRVDPTRNDIEPIPAVTTNPEPSPVQVLPVSYAMNMVKMAFEGLTGVEKVNFINEFGRAFFPNEEEIVNRRKPQWERDYAHAFENDLRRTMKDEIYDQTTTEVTELLTPKLRNLLRPEVLDTAQKLAFNQLKELLILKFKGKYSIVPADGTWKVFTGHNGKLTIESTVSIDQLLKEVTS